MRRQETIERLHQRLHDRARSLNEMILLEYDHLQHGHESCVTDG